MKNNVFQAPIKRNINNYFNFHVYLPFRRLCVRPSIRLCVRKLAPIPTVVSQNVTNKSFLVCAMGEKYTFWSPTDPSQTAAAEAKLRHIYSISKPHGHSFKSPVRLLSCEAKPSYVHTFLKKHHLLRVGPKQLCASAHLGCTPAAGTF